jgi:formylglycine-generating enzyme required for sulfatase activity
MLAAGCAKPPESRSGETAGAGSCEQQDTEHPAGQSFSDTLAAGAKGPLMIAVPCGQFSMGSTERPDEQPVHPVSIARNFAIGKYEVTFEQYDAFAEATGREKPDDNGWGRGARPVINVSWEDASAFAQWLSAQTGKHYRLPSEAEWEYAARAGSVTKFTWGDELGVSKETSATWSGALTGKGATEPVGSFAANAFGLHDVHGNAMEWVQDCFEPDYTGAPIDGTSREQCASKQRVLRGGSWFDIAFAMRSASRVAEQPSTPYETYGFRLARDLGR